MYRQKECETGNLRIPFAGTLLFDGKPWQEVVTMSGYDGDHRFENFLVHTSIYGNRSKTKNLKVMEKFYDKISKKLYKALKKDAKRVLKEMEDEDYIEVVP